MFVLKGQCGPVLLSAAVSQYPVFSKISSVNLCNILVNSCNRFVNYCNRSVNVIYQLNYVPLLVHLCIRLSGIFRSSEATFFLE